VSDPQEIINEINELKREIIEARNMNIKTDNNMRAMFAEMKKITTNQKIAERKARVSAIGAYVIFVVVIAAAAIWASGVKASQLETIISGLNERVETFIKESEGLKSDIETRQAAEKRAVFLLNLIRENKKEEAVKEFRKTEMAAFSKVEAELLKEHIDAFAEELAKNHYERGVAQWKVGGYSSAVQEFEMALDYQPGMKDRGSLSYFMGLSLVQLQKTEAAIKALKDAIASDIRSDWTATARMKIIEVLMKDKKWSDALTYMESLPLDQFNIWVRQEITQKITFVKQKLEAKAKEEAQPKETPAPVE
jgi:TolA-binding protein